MFFSVKWNATPGRKRQSGATEWRKQVSVFVKIRDKTTLDFFDNGIALAITVQPCRCPPLWIFCLFGQESSTLYTSQIVALLRSDARAQAGSIFTFAHCHCIFLLAPHPRSTKAAIVGSRRCFICQRLFIHNLQGLTRQPKAIPQADCFQSGIFIRFSAESQWHTVVSRTHCHAKYKLQQRYRTGKKPIRNHLLHRVKTCKKEFREVLRLNP